MKKTLLVLSILCMALLTYAQQPCTTDCTKIVIDKISGSTSINVNQVVCLTGSLKADMELKGGKLNVCADGEITRLIVYNPSTMVIGQGKTIKVSNVTLNAPLTIENNGGTLDFENCDFFNNLTIVNNGTLSFENPTFFSSIDLNNYGTVKITGAVDIADGSTVDNQKTGSIEITGNLAFSGRTVDFDSKGKFKVGATLTLSGQTLNIIESSLTAAKVNIISGKINLIRTCLVNLTDLQIGNGGGSIVGSTSQSTVHVTQKPELFSPGSISGLISLCVDDKTYTPYPSTVQSPAKLDCSNYVSSSESIDGSLGSEVFRLKTSNATQWNQSSNWEMFVNNAWVDATGNRYPSNGSLVYITGNKTITLDTAVSVGKLVLGDNSGSGRIIMGLNSKVLIVNDSFHALNAGSYIEVGNGALALNGVEGDVYLKGHPDGIVFLRGKGQHALHWVEPTSSANFSIRNLGFKFTDAAQSGRLTLADSTHVYGKLEPSEGFLNISKQVVLKSTATSTGVILSGSKPNYIIGNVKVEQYIPAGARRFRFLAPPVKQFTLNQWQDDVYVTGNNASGSATGNTPGTLNSAGFDATANNSPSLYQYKETDLGGHNTGWHPITNETNNLEDLSLSLGKGFRLFVRGDRSNIGRLDGSLPDQNAVTISSNGSVQTADFDFPLTFTSSGKIGEDGWQLLGNPFPADYNFAAFYQAHPELVKNIDPVVYSYNPTANTYVSYNVITRTGTMRNGIIPIGQSFWVKANASNPSLELLDAYKTQAENSALLGAISLGLGPDELDIKMVEDSVNEDHLMLKYMLGATKQKDTFDITKYTTSITIAAYDYSDSTILDLSSRPVNYANIDSIPFYVKAHVTGNYSFNIKMGPHVLTEGASYTLIDNYTGFSYNIKKVNNINFSINKAIPETEGYGRFRLVYTPALPTPTQLMYFGFSRQDSSNGLVLDWTNTKEPFPLTMRLERSYDLVNFETIGANVNSDGTPLHGSSYEVLDSAVNTAQVIFYRVYLQDTTFFGRYSPIFKVEGNTPATIVEPNSNKVSIYPNPFNNEITVSFNKIVTGLSTIRIMDITGKEISSTQVQMEGNTYTIPTQQLSNGLYFLFITNEQSGILSSHKLIK